jgi:integrase
MKILLLTGQRRAEIGQLRWSEIDLERKLIVLPETRTKNHREHLVPLSPLAMSLLPDRVEGRDWVFGMAAGYSGYSGYSWPKMALDAASGVKGWTIHDVRRTFVTLMNERGFADPWVTEAIVNHVSGFKAGVQGVYNRARHLEQARTALDRWSDYIAELVR